MSRLQVLFGFMMFAIVACQFFVVAAFGETSESAAASALADAEGAVGLTYQEVLQAEEAGANVSGLLVRLNGAAEFLARGRMEYTLGDFGKVMDLANSSRSIVEEVQNDTVTSKNAALSERLQRMTFTMAASTLSISLITLGSFWVWGVLKKRYEQSASL